MGWARKRNAVELDGDEDDEDDGAADTEGRREGRGVLRRGRMMVTPSVVDFEVEIPRKTTAARRKEVRLNDLGHRIAWLQSRVFHGRKMLLQRSCESFFLSSSPCVRYCGVDYLLDRNRLGRERS